MVADSERRDTEICVKLVMPSRGLRGFISGQSHSHPHPMPWDSQGESAVNTLHTHTHTYSFCSWNHVRDITISSRA